MHAAGPHRGPGAAAPGAFWGLFRGEKSPAGGLEKDCRCALAVPAAEAAARRGWPYRPPLHRSRHPARSVNCSDIASRRAADSRPYGENRKIMRKTTGLHAPRLPCVRGPQGSAACGRTRDRSGWAAACLGGPGRLSGNPEHRPLRKVKGQMASRSHRTLRERPLRGTDARCAPLRAPRGAQRFTFHASLFVQFAPLRRRCELVRLQQALRRRG